VRIPLDYYQILGIPENDLSELEQAYQDRLLQLPRQEYSDEAIESRKQLITVAYQVLSDPTQRAQYRSTQLSPAIAGIAPTTAAAFHQRPDLEIATEHFLGGLLILFEQGEYEEITSICMPYLGNNGQGSNSGSLHPQTQTDLTPSGNVYQGMATSKDRSVFAKLKHTASGDRIIPLKPDIVLAMVSSFCQLGEREWGDACYEEAVIHYETAKKILVQEDLFPQIQGKIDRHLDRLRPYRISSLVSLPLDRHERRRQGLQFLEELLECACNNELLCQEQFGLNSESAIPFIHATLPHLTAAEQRNLFSQVARDSPQVDAKALNVMQLACTYLHVHALIAQGFAYRNPHLIYKAQQILMYRLSHRIDVTIEQSICALLLGQTEEANQTLSTATESAALIVIRQQSQGLSTMLRGLCWYVESWLKDEVFPCFRDLVTSDPALAAYFTDRDVQDFADRVPASDPSITGWATSSPQLIDVPPSGDLSGTESLNRPNPYDDVAVNPLHSPRSAQSIGRPSSSLNPAWQPPSDRLGMGNITPAVRVEQTPPPLPVVAATTDEPDTSNVIHLEDERQRRRSMPTARTIDGQFEQIYAQERPQPALTNESSSQLVLTSKSGKLAKSSNGSNPLIRPRRTRRKPNIPRILLVGTGGVTCLWGTLWLGNKVIQALTNSPSRLVPIASTPSPSSPKNNHLLVQSSSKPDAKPTAIGLLTTDTAQQIVKQWLSAKTKALSKEHQTAQLKDILTEPALSNTIDRARSAKVDGVHWQYQHQTIGIASIAHASPQSDVATIKARVNEESQFYEGDRLNPARSYSKQLLVEYALVRQKGNWYIKSMDVIN
jgi:curved DNA-binding protein CbpA